MIIGFIAVIIFSSAIFLALNRASVYSLLFVTGVIYFSPLFFGVYVEKQFLEEGVKYIYHPIDYKTYLYSSFIFLCMAGFHVISFFSFRRGVIIDNEKRLKVILLVSLAIAWSAEVKLLIDIWGEVGSDKHHLMKVMAPLTNVKVFFQVLALFSFSVLVKQRGLSKSSTVVVTLFCIIPLFVFDLYVGYRYSLVYGCGVLFFVFFYNRKYSFWLVLKSLPVLAFLILVLSGIGNLRNEIRTFDIAGVLEKVTDIQWWVWGILNMEPVFQFHILEGTIRTGLECDFYKEVLQPIFAVLIPFYTSFGEYSTFKQCYVPEISPHFENMASNIWAQAYSYGGPLFSYVISFFVLLMFYAFGLLISIRLFFTQAVGVVLLAILSVYLHRSEFTLVIFSVSRIVLALFVTSVTAYLLTSKTFLSSPSSKSMH